MKAILTTAAAVIALSGTAAFAESHGGGDAAAGEKDFRKCKSCHAITTADGEDIVKCGRTGPNLHGVIGRQAGTYEDFKYGDSIVAAGEAGLIWDEETLVAYAADPKGFLSDYLGESAKSKMTFKLKDATDVAAYLATFSEESEMEEEGEES